MSSARRFRQQRTRRNGKSASAALRFESLESRINFSGVPFGAAATDTGEFMLGDVSVTVVFLESNGQIDASTEDWTQSLIDANKAKVDEALQWWVDTLALQNSVHELNFHIDYQYADTPVPTRYEPIKHTAAEFDKWVGDFLTYVGAERTGDIIKDIRLYNNFVRVTEGTNWAFTIFIANADDDADGFWDGNVLGGFSIAGGAFLALPSSRPASTIAHETAHQFWAMDEYGGKDYYDHRGYYDTQNTNATLENPHPELIVDSLMLSGQRLQNAYDSHTSSTSLFETIGWKDSDGDGIFDVLDQPLSLKGSGALDADTLQYHFVGQAAVGVLPNLNTAGTQQSVNKFLQHDMTINTVAAVQYRIDGGDWQTAQTYDDYVADIDISIALPNSGNHTIEIRAIDATGAITSDVLTGSTSEITPVAQLGANGFLFADRNGNGVYDFGETGLTGWTVALVDSQSTPVQTEILVEPDDFGAGDVIDDLVPGASFSAFGDNITPVFPNVFSLTNVDATTGARVFGYYRSTDESTGNFSEWNSLQQLRVDFDSLVSRVSIDAIGTDVGSIGRLEAFDALGNLIGRYTTAELAAGEAETMSVEFDSPQISYIVVAGQLETSVRLDNFSAGRPATVETDAFGAFALQMDVAGDYQLQITPPGGDSQSYSIVGSTTVNYALAPLTGFQFAIHIETLAWRNPYNAADVNDDGTADESDFELILAELTNQTYLAVGQITGDHSSPAPFLDANGDGYFNLLDAMRVLDRLLIAQLGTPPQEGEAVVAGDSFIAGSSSGDEAIDSSQESSLEAASLPGESLVESESSVSASNDFVVATAAQPFSASLADLGLGKLTATVAVEGEDIAFEGGVASDEVSLSIDSSNSMTVDDRILAIAADDFYLGLGRDDEDGEFDLFDPWGGDLDIIE
ncbi:dockerin type I domain-containing protein [Blastopirellula sp. JC732]|uniref:Dockerin type I domain-containing protein n=1 Tax=Blastopirellula sediminis TaxID=2894196 RepID=A0A9X1MU25_9BACT|nr:dockerin type I domain-containing protein [Blastopirellula sediminis]MCC9604609.1 dockerin type I domain-containing protein [Blastopirellula sediminis]MCC9632092.1 dockerin type I domain-containing protein [Blastopirellula sediminis]